MRQQDHELASFGAEALPGGLNEINETRHGPARATDPRPRTREKTPLVGLVDLVTSWLGKGARRR